MKYGMLYAGVIMAAGTLLVQLLAAPVLRLFNASPELLSVGGAAMRVISLSYIFTAYIVIAQGVFQAFGNGVYSLIVTLLRVVVVLLPLLWAFSLLFPLRLVWWAFVASEVISAAASAVFLRRICEDRFSAMRKR